MFDMPKVMQPKGSYIYSEHSLAVYANGEGSVTLEQDQSWGITGVTLAVSIDLGELERFSAALRSAKGAITSPASPYEVQVGKSEVYVSERGNICVLESPGEEPIVIEPHRVDAVLLALQTAAAEASSAGSA